MTTADSNIWQNLVNSLIINKIPASCESGYWLHNELLFNLILMSFSIIISDDRLLYDLFLH